MSVNKVILVGRLGKDPEVRYSTEGKATTSLSLATSEHYKDKAGEKVEKTEWHRVVFFGKSAEVVGEYAKKGDQLYVEGKVSTRKWQDKAGADRYTTEVIGDRFQFLGPREGGKAASAERPAAASSSGAGAIAPGGAGHKAGGFDEMDDDIPF